MSSTLKRKAAGNPANGSDAKKPKQAGIMSFFGSSPSSKNGNGSNGSSAAPSQSAAATFDKAKWVESLTPEQRELLQLEINTLHESWLAHLKNDITSHEFLELKRFLNRETKAGKKWFPPAEDVYSWSRHTPFNTVKVVIVGQDPYHNVNQAHGLAFSVRPPTPAPPSLRNMYIALKNDYPSFTPPPKKAGLLTPWADRGVLLLNTCLTVRAHEANSHSNRGWERFTQRVLDLVATKRTRGVVYMAWGTPAGRRVSSIDKKKHLVLQAVHPSPLSASRGFFHCGHFKKANEWLVTRYGEGAEINWDLGGALSEGAVQPAGAGAAAQKTLQQKPAESQPKAEGTAANTATATTTTSSTKVEKTPEEEKENVKVVEKETVDVKDGEVTKVEAEKKVETEA